MDNEYIESLRKQVKTALKKDPSRYRHTLGVAATSACLAMRYNVDMQQAYIAGLLHDCAKCVPDDGALCECMEYGIDISKSECISPYLLHAKLGAYYAEHVYHITEENICDAVRYHTTGRAHMSRLEEIVFIADYIEPYRNRADNLDAIRALVFQDIEQAVYEVTKSTLNYLTGKGCPIDPATEDTFQYYQKFISARQIQETNNK